MNAYSVGLRRKIVESVSAGAPEARVARAFGVGPSTVRVRELTACGKTAEIFAARLKMCSVQTQADPPRGK
jgi:transposase-like protein